MPRSSCSTNLMMSLLLSVIFLSCRDSTSGPLTDAFIDSLPAGGNKDRPSILGAMPTLCVSLNQEKSSSESKADLAESSTYYDSDMSARGALFPVRSLRLAVLQALFLFCPYPISRHLVIMHEDLALTTHCRDCQCCPYSPLPTCLGIRP